MRDGERGGTEGTPSDAPAPRQGGTSVSGLRIAYAPSPPGAIVARSLKDQVERVATLATGAGARVEELLADCDWDSANALFGELVSVITSERISADLGWYFAALDQRDRFLTAWKTFFRGVDALLMPPAMTAAFPHCEPGTPLSVDGTRADYFGQGALLAMANVAGLPALVAPAGHDADGLPIGVQIVGPQWSEMRLLAIGRAMESARILPGFKPPPAQVPS